jgi:hypothetical protein
MRRFESNLGKIATSRPNLGITAHINGQVGERGREEGKGSVQPE